MIVVDTEDNENEPQQQAEEEPKAMIEAAANAKVTLDSAELAQQLAEAWQQTGAYQSLRGVVQAADGELPSLEERDPKYILGRFAQFAILLRRQIPLNYYNWQFMIRTSRVVLLAFLYLFLFWNIAALGTDGSPVAFSAAVLLFLAVILLWGGSSMQLNEPVVAVVLPVERMDSYYSMLSYSVSIVCAEAPFFFLDTILVTIIFYLGLGMNLDNERIVYFGLVLFLMGSLISTLMNCCRALAGQDGLATALGMQVAVLSAAYGTFFRTRENMPVWLQWATYVSPLTWFYQGILSNQYQGTKFDGCQSSYQLPHADDPLLDVPVDQGGFGGVQVCAFSTGNELLKLLDIPTDYGWKWICLAVIVGYVVLFFAFLILAMQKFIKPLSQLREAPKVSGHVGAIPEAQPLLSVGDFTFCCNDISYSIPAHQDWLHVCSRERRTLIRDINFVLRPGMVVALMGPSGAGKTTLLNILSARFTKGRIDQGQFYLNGHPQNNSMRRRIVGYVEQESTHDAYSTVREEIHFSSLLRNNGNSIAARRAYADYIMASLSLNPIANEYMSSSNVTPSQRKLISSAVELAGSSHILILDEPTTGLSASASLYLTQLIADASKSSAVLLSLHQPSPQIMKIFTHLLVLNQNGQQVYFGPSSGSHPEIIQYCNDNFGQKPSPLTPPMDFIVETICPSPEDLNYDPAAAWLSSAERQVLMQDIQQQLSQPSGPHKSPYRWDRFFLSIWLLMIRMSKANIRSIFYFITIVITSVVWYMFSWVFFDMDQDQAGLRDEIAFVAALVSFGAVMKGAELLFVFADRIIFYREHWGSFYTTGAYTLAGTMVVFLFDAIYSFIMAIGSYFIAGQRLENGTYFWTYWLFYWLYFVICSLVARLAVFGTPTSETSVTVYGIVTSVWGAMMGFSYLPSEMNEWSKWVYWSSPGRAAFQSIVENQIAGLTYYCLPGQLVSIPVTPNTTVLYCPFVTGEEYLTYLGIGLNYLWYDLIPMFGWISLLVLLWTLSLYNVWINR